MLTSVCGGSAGRIALYSRRSATEEQGDGDGKLTPSESAALKQLDAFLPTNISAAYRRAVLIQVRAAHVQSLEQRISESLKQYDGFVG